MQLTTGSFKESPSLLDLIDAYNMYIYHKKTIWNSGIVSLVKPKSWKYSFNKTSFCQMCDSKLLRFNHWKFHKNNYSLKMDNWRRLKMLLERWIINCKLMFNYQHASYFYSYITHIFIKLNLCNFAD